MILAVDSPENHHTVVSRWSNGPFAGTGYERQPVITGHRPQKWRRGDSETKQKKILQNILPDEFAITFYIIQRNWLCLNYNLVSRSHSETPVA